MSDAPQRLRGAGDQRRSLVTELLSRGVPADEITTRFAVLFPEDPPELVQEELAQARAPQRPRGPEPEDADPERTAVALGVELVAAVLLQAEQDPHQAALLDGATVRAALAITSGYDPSGAASRGILAVVAPAREILARRPLELTPHLYEMTRARLAGPDASLPEDAAAWPAPWRRVAQRLGGGDWGRAMRALGLEWSVEDPEAVLTAPTALSGRQEEVEFVLAQPAPEPPQDPWSELIESLERHLAGLPWADVLLMAYSPAHGAVPGPSAWASSGPDGIRCYLSGQGVASAAWPWDEGYFASGDWVAPSEWYHPWSAGPFTAEEAADLLVEGLRVGRRCRDPFRYRWGTGPAREHGSALAEPVAAADQPASPPAVTPPFDHVPPHRPAVQIQAGAAAREDARVLPLRRPPRD